MDIGNVADLVIVLGGDGTMLNVARILATTTMWRWSGSIKVGSAFTDVSVDTMTETLGEILDGEYTSENRFLLDVSSSALAIVNRRSMREPSMMWW